MSKWIYGKKNKMLWNLDRAYKIRLLHNRIEIIIDDDGGVQYVEFDSEEELAEAWKDLTERLVR